MSVDERRRLELADAAKRMLGDDAGLTLMELLPPVGWADVATKPGVFALRGDLRVLRDDVASLRGAFNGLRNDFAGLHREFDELRNDFKDLRHDVDVGLEQGFRQILVTMTTLVISGFLVGILAIVATIVAVALVR